MQLLDALITLGRQDTETWAIQADNVILYCTESDGREIYHVHFRDPIVGLPGEEGHDLAAHSLAYSLAWLVDEGKRELVFGDRWQIVPSSRDSGGE